jgi:hypothetical protein
VKEFSDVRAAEDYICELAYSGLIDFSKDIVLCPKNGKKVDEEFQPATVNSLNRRLLEIDRHGMGLGHKFLPGDRVINTENMPDLQIWNGTTGEILSVDQEGNIRIKLDDPIIVNGEPRGDVLVPKDQTKALNYAYEPVWWVYSSLLAAFFVAMPFSRYMHIFTEIPLIFLRRWQLRPTMERIYVDRKDNMDMRIAFPITDGRLRYSIPVELQKCKDTDCAEIYRVFAKIALFTTIDDAWREHLREMDDLRQSVQNATYEQKDPLLIYKLESFQLFSKMLEEINRDVLALLNKSTIAVRENNPESMQQAREQKQKIDVNKLQASRMAAAAAAGQGDKGKTAPIKVDKSVGRNEPCPCGSGKKYKHCHGKLG